MKGQRYLDGVIRRLPGGAWLADRSSAYVRKRTRHDTIEAAKSWISAEVLAASLKSPQLSADQILDYHSARELMPAGVPLRQAAEEWRKRHSLSGAGKTLAEVVAEFIADRHAAGCRQRYLTRLSSECGKLTVALGSQRMVDVTAADLTPLLAGVSPATRKTLRSTWQTLWGFAIAQQAALDNAASKLTKAKINDSSPAILTPEQARKVMKMVPAKMKAFMALSLYAGLRTAELDALDWSAVGKRFITIGPDVAKTRSRRTLPLLPVVAKIIKPLRRTEGPVASLQARQRGVYLRKIALKMGLAGWPHNVARHSYISYRLAQTSDLAKVALEAGNTPNVIHRHYKELVTPRAAKEYFSVVSVPNRRHTGK